MKNAFRKLKTLTGVALKRLVRRLFPEVCVTREETIRSMCKMNERIREQRAEVAHWRNRCLSAEAIISYGIRHAVRDATKDHDDKFGTGLSYW